MAMSSYIHTISQKKFAYLSFHRKTSIIIYNQKYERNKLTLININLYSHFLKPETNIQQHPSSPQHYISREIIGTGTNNAPQCRLA